MDTSIVPADRHVQWRRNLFDITTGQKQASDIFLVCPRADMCRQASIHRASLATIIMDVFGCSHLAKQFCIRLSHQTLCSAASQPGRFCKAHTQKRLQCTCAIYIHVRCNSGNTAHQNTQLLLLRQLDGNQENGCMISLRQAQCARQVQM